TLLSLFYIVEGYDSQFSGCEIHAVRGTYLAHAHESDFQYYGHDQRALLRLLGNVALQVCANLLLNHTIVSLLLLAGDIERLHDYLAGSVHEAILSRRKPTAHDLRTGFYTAAKLVNRDDGQHDAILTEVAPVLDNKIFDHIGARARIDAHAANVDPSRFARAQLIEFQNIATFNKDNVSYSAMHRPGHLGMELELTVFAVDRNEIAGFYQVDDKF